MTMTNSENRSFQTIQEIINLLGISIFSINGLIKEGYFLSKIQLSPGRKVIAKFQLYELIKIKKTSSAIT